MNQTAISSKCITTLLFACLLAPGVSLAAATPPPAPNPSKPPIPQWIWGGTETQDKDVYYFRKTFEIPAAQGIKSASAWVSCDNSFECFLNKSVAGEGKDWHNAIVMDVSGLVQPGKNVLAIRGVNDGGIAGLIAKIRVTFNDDSTQEVASDATWRVSSKDPKPWKTDTFDDSTWAAARVLGAYGMAPWGDVESVVQKPAESTPADKLTTLPGFAIERLYSVPNGSQGSWISIVHDPKGRLIVSDQGNAGLFRVTPGTDAASTKVEKLQVQISGAHGLLWAFDSLYVTVNGGGLGGHGSGVYKLHYNPDTDQFDDVKQLFSLEGSGEHGPHALKLGRDNKLYLLCGNATKVPKDLLDSSPHKRYAEDQLIAREPDGNGFMTGVLAPGGYVCKMDPDGSHRELLCAGLRNACGFDFNTDGELFAWDNDMEWDIGAPWYEPTRIVMCNSGGEYGWRFGAGRWPDYYPDSLPSVGNSGLGSPVNIAFGTGAKFPAKYQRALFTCEWAYGSLDAFYLTPQGAGYTCTFEPFVQGKPFNCTAVCVNTDGAMYVTIGGRGSQSGLYRIRYVGNESTAPAAPEVDSAAAETRDLRHHLESYHGHADTGAVDFAWPWLSSNDRFLNTAARVAIESQDLATWKQKALDETRPTAAITAAIALTHVGDNSLHGPVLELLNRIPIRSLSNEQLTGLLRADGLVFERLGAPSSAEREALIARFDPLFPSQDMFVNRELCRMLIFLDAPDVITKTMAQLAAATSQEEQLYYIYVLRNQNHGWTLDQRKAYFAALARANDFTGGASIPKYIIHIRAEAVESLTPGEKTALGDLVSAKHPQAAVLIKPRKFVKNWQVEDLQPRIDQVSSGRSFDKGKEVFETIGCTQCHRFSNKGGSVGPDLTGVGGRFSASDIAAKLCFPSRAIADQYANTTIVTKNHDIVEGRLQNEDDKSVTLLTNFFTNDSTTVQKDQIVKRQKSKLSPMPRGLIDNLEESEIFDLIAYLRSAGNSKDKAFSTN
jgi:putative heme-binding domain-containing protein